MNSLSDSVVCIDKGSWNAPHMPHAPYPCQCHQIQSWVGREVLTKSFTEPPLLVVSNVHVTLTHFSCFLRSTESSPNSALLSSGPAYLQLCLCLSVLLSPSRKGSYLSELSMSFTNPMLLAVIMSNKYSEQIERRHFFPPGIKHKATA